MQLDLHNSERFVYLFVLCITGIDGGMLSGELGFTGFSLFLAGLAGLVCLLTFLSRRCQPYPPHLQPAYARQQAR